MWLKLKRVSFDFLPGRGRRDPHIDVQGTFHHSEQWLACKEYEKRKNISLWHILRSIVSYSTKFNPLTIQQRQPPTQCVAVTQKRLRMGSVPKLFSGPASSDREKWIFGKKIYCFNLCEINLIPPHRQQRQQGPKEELSSASWPLLPYTFVKKTFDQEPNSLNGFTDLEDCTSSKRSLASYVERRILKIGTRIQIGLLS